ncbi:alpha/beta fold hydrolase [Nodosilinea sp. PGN35]|uniref:alpha/beta fold hydrolase n=1 Tax=Nodosilinea sp. PGN35 TaxID=3020489 RepID=UPI0023B24349|nr:alpha/beta fold hydrolase [Nodosilinea sp. TSF1-S3]MDF0368251.1 alpha/beta fold hydrolase [Nodosilinea sp. TSF1-S3]
MSSILLSSLPSTLSQSGYQRFWHWRGWRVRYWFHPGPGDALGDVPGDMSMPPLLLIHGFGANLNQWRHNLPALSQVTPVYAIDLLGFGDSEKAATLYGAELWAAQVADFIRQVIGQPVALVGHSLGALVALTATHNHPAWVRQLALITLPLEANREDLVAGWVAALALRVESLVANPLLMRSLFALVRRPSFLRRALAGVYTVAARVDDDLVNAFALPTGDRGAARTLCYLVRSRTDPRFSPSVKDMVAAIAVPMLLLWGDQDRVIPIGLAQGLTGLSQHLCLEVVANVGHCLYDEADADFNQRLLTWLKHPSASGVAEADD